VANVVKVGLGQTTAPDRLAEWLRSSPILKHSRDAAWLKDASLADLVTAFDSEEMSVREHRPLARLKRWFRALIAAESSG
jgi:hypothetical protein